MDADDDEQVEAERQRIAKQSRKVAGLSLMLVLGVLAVSAVFLLIVAMLTVNNWTE